MAQSARISAMEPPEIELQNLDNITPHLPTEPAPPDECTTTTTPGEPGPVPDNKPSTAFRSDSFAEKRTLSWWFPSINADEKGSWRIWLSRRSRALLMQIALVGTILITNVALTAFAFSAYRSTNGVALIYDDDCDKVKELDQWIHLLINLLSTGMLSASNYCMQLQAAPTRADVDRAHRADEWLDIGVPSWRNYKYISGWRQFSWFLLAISSLPIHLIYNSAVFQSLASNDYTIAVVKDSFLHGSSWSLATAERNRKGDNGWEDPDSRVNPAQDYQTIISDIQRAVASYEEKNVSACFDLYDDYFAPQGNAVIFVKNESVQTPNNDSLLMYVSVIPRSDDWAKNMWAVGNGTGNFVANSPAKPVTSWFLGPPKYEVSYCLVQPPGSTTNRCRFEYSPPIMFTVCILNFLKTSVMFCVWALRKLQKKDSNPQNEVLYTLGDAISSFMRVPDKSTENMCLATRYDFLSRRPASKYFEKQLPEPKTEPRPWKPERKLWMSAGSLTRWFVLLFMCILVILVAGILLGLSFTSLQHRKISTTVPDLWNLGFGSLTQFTYLVVGLPRADPAGLISNVLLANLPQLILSILYLFYNSMLSTFLVQREFSHMYSGKKRKTLRVSEPIGLQRSSYFISLPLRYGIPLYATSGLMHWLISQSLFLARVTALTPDGLPDNVNSFSTCGYSPIAVIITLIVGLCLVAAIIVVGFRKYDGTMRMVSTNSKAISAACHVLSEDLADGYQLPVRWGVVQIHDDGVGHCAFTTAPDHSLKELQEGQLYR